MVLAFLLTIAPPDALVKYVVFIVNVTDERLLSTFRANPLAAPPEKMILVSFHDATVLGIC